MLTSGLLGTGPAVTFMGPHKYAFVASSRTGVLAGTEKLTVE